MDEKKEYAGGNEYFLENVLENADFGIMIATDADDALDERLLTASRNETGELPQPAQH